MPHISLRNTLFLGGLLLLLAACGGGGGGGGGSSNTTAPTAIVTTDAPAALDPALIPQTTVITVTFSESMDTTVGTWGLGGDLGSESDGGVWSQTNVIDDTLTITAFSGNWIAAPDRTLTIDAQDLAGNALGTMRVVYDIYRGGLYYVDGSKPAGTTDGLTPASAFTRLHIAVANATAPATILVSAGDYRVSNQLGTHIVLREGVSLYGGYNADFTQHNPAMFITSIEDTSTANVGTFLIPLGYPVGANPIYGDGTTIPITPATVIDGFTIRGSTQGAADTHAILLFTNASPTIQNNIIIGGGGSDSNGIASISNASPIVKNNSINGGSAVNPCAVYNDHNAYPLILNNSIHGGTGNATFGIRNFYNSSPLIDNNTIYGGDGATISTGIENGNNSSPSIQNNVINGGVGGHTTIGIRNISPSSVLIQNNSIYGGDAGHDTTGIYNSDFVSLVMLNNIIHAGNGVYITMGINSIRNTSLTLRNNTIYGGSGIDTAMAARYDSSTSTLQNNILMTRYGLGSYCVYDANSATPDMQNNNLYNCMELYEQFNVPCGSNTYCSTADQVNSLAGASNNVSIDPAFADIDGIDNNINTMNDNDWRLSNSSPVEITTGGLNGIYERWSFTTDKDGVIRPASGQPWSIGAYEP